MMKIIKILLVLAILFISISAVSAEGNFTALQDEIDSSTDFLEITQDYVYDNSTDYELIKGINITKNDFTINGNGHTIDASNQARIFTINGNNVTLKNLNIINGNAKNGGALYILSDATLTTKNIVFKDDNGSEMGGAVANLGRYTSINDSFIDNCADMGGAIYSQGGELNIINGTFSSENSQNWALIYMMYTSMYIENTTFANTTSNYSTAIFAFQSTGKIRKSTFINLTATMTAGAIGIKELCENITIDDCDFTSTYAERNGGAIYADVGGDYGLCEGNITIINSRFTDCFSEFGGAYLQLAGHLTIDSTNFTSNIALFDGGAIYTSWVETVNITNSIFTSNIGYYDGFSNGGAAYFDMGNVTIDSCIFENNTASEGSSLHTYDCNVSLFDNYFNNPAENGSSIYGVYCKYYESGNNFTDDILSLNNTNYDLNVESSQTKFNPLNNTINVETLPKRFDLRDWGWVSPVKNQGNMGACWAFSSTSTLESVLIRYANVTYDFSENNLQNTMLKYSKYGDERMAEGGNIFDGIYYYSSWLGVSPAIYDTYDELGKISPLIATDDDIHIKNIIIISERKNSTDNDWLKKALLKYGAVSTNYYDEENPAYYNEETYGYYNYEITESNHVACIVGWDDTYPKENFVETPPGDGAFIIKNSWGTEWGDEGYFYISYYDISFATDDFSMTFDMKNNNDYDKLYQHEIVYKDYSNHTYAMNKFVAQENLMIAAVASLNVASKSYDFSILVNGEKVYEQNGTYEYYGYATVELDEFIPVMKGDEFAVISKSTEQNFGTARKHAQPHVSFVSYDGVEWEDLTEKEAAAMIKVYTFNLDIYTQDLVKIYKNDSKFVANIGIANETVNFEINGINYTRKSDENGSARMAINLEPGSYTIKTTFNGTTVENTITVLPTLIADNLVKYYRNASQFFISLIDGKNNPVSGVNITMNINGVFYNRTTNENGTAKLNINLEPGEYILTAIDPLTGLMMSYNITVLPVLSADNMEMTYMDGSTFNATVIDGEGKTLANASVTFNINGVFYTRTTDSSGIARLNIRLMAGEYIITSEYDGMRIANTITIKD
ncbi:C1 family peptidase [Methanobrevibacter sp.]|uniref:C1 family peptidase n=1 Tax=Methanobrevibacter sp. TaxID=66852 RepID=UPI00388EA48F